MEELACYAYGSRRRYRPMFFTNALQGLLRTRSNTGSVEGHNDPAFRKGCREVFVSTLSRQAPSIVLALGKAAIRFLVEIYPEHLRDWITPKGINFLSIDASEKGPVKRSIPLQNGPGMFNAVALTHPSYQLNSARRTYKEWAGADCEVAMIRGHHRGGWVS